MLYVLPTSSFVDGGVSDSAKIKQPKINSIRNKIFNIQIFNMLPLIINLRQNNNT